jgi:hypothetical protein
VRSEPWESASQYIYFRPEAAAPCMTRAKMASSLGLQGFAKRCYYLRQSGLGKCRSIVAAFAPLGLDHAGRGYC